MAAGKTFVSRVRNLGSQLVLKQQDQLIEKFIDIVYENDKETAVTLIDVLEIAKSAGTRKQRDEAYKTILTQVESDPAKHTRFMEAYAKLLDIGKRSRKTSNAEIFQAEKQGTTADSFSYVLKKAHKEGVAPGELAEFFRTNAVAMFSLTAHPTNSTTLEYTKAGMMLDSALDRHEGLEDALLAIYETPISGAKKTQEQEVQETILILDNVYKSSAQIKHKLDAELIEYPAYRAAIDTSKPLIEPCIWATGDGDGNDNATAQSLTNGIGLLRARIKELYLQDLASIAGTEEVQQKLRDGSYSSPQGLLADLGAIRGTEDLQYKVKTFGLHYAKIDIRHNSEDIMLTMANVASKLGLIGKEEFLALPEKEQEAAITRWLQDERLAPLFTSINAEALTDKKAQNIFSRLQVIGRNPDMSDKFIIAENKSSANALAALLLLKATRPVGAAINMDVVTLSESVPDLQAMPGIINDLISNPVYRQHIERRGCVMPMIAKSDTTRRHGVGATTEQEAAIGKVYKLVEDEFKGRVAVKGYNGGGCALQRGGGRITEVPHAHGRAARKNGATQMGPSTLTIQGVQQQVLLSPGLNACQTMEALAAQNLSAAMQTKTREKGERHIQPHVVPEELVTNMKRELGLFSVTAQEAERMQLEAFDAVCARTRSAYFGYVGDPDQKDGRGKPLSPGNPAFNELFTKGPWLSVKYGNLSSRPDKRGASDGGNTVENLKGKKPVLLDNRAITVERNSGHSGTHFLTYLGLVEGLEPLNTKQLHNMYLGSKSCRDLMRNTATSLHMTDFETSWRMMIGAERPSDAEIQTLASAFQARHVSAPAAVPTDPAELLEYNKQTLAFIECSAMQVAIQVYRCVLGEESAEGFTLKTSLQEAWPNLAQQLGAREKIEEFAHLNEAKLTHTFNENPEMEITPGLIRHIQVTACACDVATNAPEGMMNTLTKTIEQLCEAVRGR